MTIIYWLFLFLFLFSLSLSFSHTHTHTHPLSLTNKHSLSISLSLFLFSGLRGAVSLALSISVLSHIDERGDDVSTAHSALYDPPDDRITFPRTQVRQVVFLICGVVALTILLNGTLSRSFFVFLYAKVDEKTTEADTVILHYVRKRIWMRTEDGKLRIES